jgi:membrane protease YdiL (CAAX protease family)
MSGEFSRNPFMDDPQQRLSEDVADTPSSSTENFSLPPAISPALPPGAHQIFIGSGELRIVWRLLLYWILRQAIYFLLSPFTYYLDKSGALYLWVMFAAETIFLLAAVGPGFIMAVLEGRRFSDYGLPLRHAFGKTFWMGTAWGFGAITLLMLGLHAAGAFQFGGLAIHGMRLLKFAVFWGAFFLLVGIAEEFYLRGYPQFTLTQGIGFWPAAIVLSAAFGAIHFRNPGETPVGLLGAALIGLFFCLTLRRTGTLWFALGFHAAWDWGESYVYSVPDSGGVSPGHLIKSSLHGPAWLSGGSVGPEGSLLLFILIILLWIVFDRTHRKIKYPAVEAKIANAV